MEAAAVDVAHEHLAAIRRRPGTAQVDHGAAVGVPAAGAVGAIVASVRAAADVMAVGGNGLDCVVGVRVEVFAGLPMITPALDNVESVRDDAGLAEPVAVIVVVQAPGV